MGQKSGQRVRNSPNKDQVASDLLWESINSGFRPTVGIHQFLHRSCCGNPIINKWIPTAAPMTELVDSHSRSDAKGVLFGQFLTLWPDFWPTLGLFGENRLLRLLLVWGQKKLWADKKKSPYFPFKSASNIILECAVHNLRIACSTILGVRAT